MYVCLNRATAGAGLDFEQFVHLAAEAGFAGCDVDMGWGQQHGAAALAELFKGKKLRFGGWGPNVNWRKSESNPDRDLPALDAQAKVAAELGIDTCSTWIMPSSALPFMENWQFHVRNLRKIAQVLSGHGLRLGLEFVAPHHLRRQFAHEFIFTPGLMLELAAEVGENVGLLVDSFHCHSGGASYQHLSSLPREKIVLAHINDCPSVPVEQVQDFQRVLPGSGCIDLPAFVEALGNTGYDGPVSLEVFSDELKALPPLEAARRAWAACRQALATTGIV